MAFHPATLVPAPELFKRCGFGSCRELAGFVLTAGGQKQVFCCLDHGRIGIEADKQAPGQGWKKAK